MCHTSAKIWWWRTDIHRYTCFRSYIIRSYTIRGYIIRVAQLPAMQSTTWQQLSFLELKCLARRILSWIWSASSCSSWSFIIRAFLSAAATMALYPRLHPWLLIRGSLSAAKNSSAKHTLINFHSNSRSWSLLMSWVYWFITQMLLFSRSWAIASKTRIFIY